MRTTVYSFWIGLSHTLSVFHLRLSLNSEVAPRPPPARLRIFTISIIRMILIRQFATKPTRYCRTASPTPESDRDSNSQLIATIYRASATSRSVLWSVFKPSFCAHTYYILVSVLSYYSLQSRKRGFRHRAGSPSRSELRNAEKSRHAFRT